MANYPTKAQRFDAALKAELTGATASALSEKISFSDFEDIEAIADPSTATAEDVATLLNSIIAIINPAPEAP